MNRNPKDLSFFGHVDELRGRLIKSIVAVLIASFLFYGFIDKVFAILIKPVGKLVFTSPGEAFVARIYLALFGGFFLALPVLLFQVWKFVAAGLKEREIRYIRIFGPGSFVLFILGGIFAYFIAIPISVQFLLSFSSDIIVPMITIKSYIAFVGTMLLAFGLVFELPLVLMFLTIIGVATPAYLIHKRRYAVVIILIISAFVTPPDVITQMIMAVPLILLYEIGIITSKLIYRK